jgi:transcriptional regulator GlxA family with amidase domain
LIATSIQLSFAEKRVKMKHISILIPNGKYSVVNVMGSLQIFQVANEIQGEKSGTPLFELDLIGFSESYPSIPGLANAIPTKLWHDVVKTDLIILPAVFDSVELIQKRDPQLLKFLTDHYKQGTRLVTMCIGTYIFAATGLLDGKVCSTHWEHADGLRKKFPKVIVREEKLIAEQDGIITCGGAYAFPNLIVYLVEKYGGRELAVKLAKTFMIDLDRTYQSPYMIFNGNKKHGDDIIVRTQKYIESNFASKFNIENLADQNNLTRRTLERRFKTSTGHSIIEYTQKVRTEIAKKDLELGRKTVIEIMFDCGYNDPKAFRDVFKKFVGLSPLEYRKKYKKGADQLKIA